MYFFYQYNRLTINVFETLIIIIIIIIIFTLFYLIHFLLLYITVTFCLFHYPALVLQNK